MRVDVGIGEAAPGAEAPDRAHLQRLHGVQPERRADTAGLHHLRQMIRRIARGLRRLGHTVDVMPAGRRPLRLPAQAPAPGARTSSSTSTTTSSTARSTRCAWPPSSACIGFPITGSPGAGPGPEPLQVHVRQPARRARASPSRPARALLERIGDVDRHKWQLPAHRPAQPGARRHRARTATPSSTRKTALRHKVRDILADLQAARPGPALPAGPRVQRRASSAAASSASCRSPRSTTRACRGGIPPIMSYAAKWVETDRRIPEDRGHLPGPRSSRSSPRASARPRCGPSAPSAAGATAGSTSGSTRTACPASSRSTAIPCSTAAWAWPARRDGGHRAIPQLLQLHHQGRVRRPARTTCTCPSSAGDGEVRARPLARRAQPVSRPV